MKLNKILYSLLIAILMVSLSACGSDDDDKIHSNADLLQGDTWIFQKAVVSFMGQTMEMTLSQIRQMYASELGTNNIMFIDEKLKFEKDYMVMVNTGERYAYKYMSDGTLWIEGMDELSGVDDMNMSIKVKSLTSKQLVLRYDVTIQGMTIGEDVYYTR